jgi:hypothetical protein
MKQFKTYLRIGYVVIILGMVLAIVYYLNETAKYKELYNKELTNVKAYQSENNDLKNQSIAHIMTIDQLIASKDSSDIALKEALKKLNVKPKNVVSAGSVTSNIEKRDSIIFIHDTIFQSKVNIDTIIGDKWYKAQVGLHYPSRIDLTVSVQSVKHIVVHNKKETINPPKKFWLWRLFQRKHTIQEVLVDEENPHIKSGSQRFINIIK